MKRPRPRREAAARRPSRLRAVLPSFAAAALAAAAAGCRSAASWRAEADARAAAGLAAAQRAAAVREEEIEVESPADTLRRRLLLDQGLAAFDPASLGLRDLPTNLYWSAAERLLPGGGGGAAAFAPGGTNALEIGLADAVRIAAHNAPDYQAAKESLFRAALELDLEDHAFHTTWQGALRAAAESARAEGADRESAHEERAAPGLSRTFENGTTLAGSLGLNLAGMLTGDRATAWGAVADLSVSIPLLRGAGALVRREALTQAERDLVYAVRAFEQRKRAFAVEIEQAYLSLLLARRTRENEDANYRRVRLSTQRSRRMADASRMSLADFDQSYQSELAARASWTAACQEYESRLDVFKRTLGLPPDARIAPRESDLADLRRYAEALVGAVAEESGAEAPAAGGPAAAEDRPASVDEGAMKSAADRAVAFAAGRREDFRTHRDRVEDAQRHLVVAEDALRAEVTLGGRAAVGQAATAAMGAEGRDHADFKMSRASYDASLTIDLPFQRTAERNAYRLALVALEEAVRDYQRAEDELKATVREDLRTLSQTREQLRIQFRAVALAERRVRNQDLLLEAGRAEMTDLLDAQNALVSAQNALYAAITAYRGQELALRRDLGLLDVSADGAWSEEEPLPFDPGELP